jgi:chromosome segregation ATPase
MRSNKPTSATPTKLRLAERSVKKANRIRKTTEHAGDERGPSRQASTPPRQGKDFADNERAPQQAAAAIPDAHERKADFQHRIERVLSKLQALEADGSALRKGLATAHTLSEEQAAHLEHARLERDQARRDLDDVSARLREGEIHRSDLQTSLAEAEERWRAAERQMAEKEARAAEVDAALVAERAVTADLRSALDDRLKELQALEADRSALEADRSALKKGIETAHTLSEEQGAHLEHARLERDQARRDLDDISARLRDGDIHRLELQRSLAEAEERLTQAQADAQSQRELVASYQRALAEDQVMLFSKTNELYDLQARYSRARCKNMRNSKIIIASPGPFSVSGAGACAGQ